MQDGDRLPDQEKSDWCWAWAIQHLASRFGADLSQPHIVTQTKGSPKNASATAGEMMTNIQQWSLPNGDGTFSMFQPAFHNGTPSLEELRGARENGEIILLVLSNRHVVICEDLADKLEATTILDARKRRRVTEVFPGKPLNLTCWMTVSVVPKP